MLLQVSGHPAVAPHMTKFYGIRNGIDQDIWDPLEDRFLPRSAQLLAVIPLSISVDCDIAATLSIAYQPCRLLRRPCFEQLAL